MTMKVLLVSWEYPPVVIGGLGRHVHHLATELAAAGHDVVVLSRRPTATDPHSHPTTDEVADGVRVIAAAEDPHEFAFGTDMMAWTLAMGHAMIRAGIDLLNPVQTSAAGMDPQWLKDTFGDRITFWGGGVDTQRVLPFGTPEEVYEHVAEHIRIFAPGGGFVWAPIHNIQNTVPPENIVAALQAVRDHGNYPMEN